MKEYDATEVAYNNGYKKGIEDLFNKLKERYEPIPLWGAVAVSFMESIVRELVKD